MAKPILDEALWAVLELLLPPDPPRPRGGRPRVPHRQVLTGILFVLRSGIPWELLPRRTGLRLGHDLLAQAERSGTLKAFGNAFTMNCSTGAVPAWTAAACRPNGAGRSRAPTRP